MNQSLPQTPRGVLSFGPLPVGAPIARALASMRYDVPTPIQEQAIPVLRERRDVLGQAQTGTGKTAGFGIPLLETIDPSRRAVQAIILVPTRELCLQVADELRRLGEHLRISIVSVYGGVGLLPQMNALRNGGQVVVGTPGRVEDLLARGALRLDGVRVAILDEADRMLDVGFLPAIERILGRTPRERQTALFSATIPEDVRGLAQRHMRSPVTISVSPDHPTVDEIEQRFERVPDGDKLAALSAHLDDPSCFLALVFRRTTFKADRLARDLSRRGYKVAVLHGRRTQGQRERVLADLKACKIQALVATDIAARGLDIAGLTHVFNYDLPDTPETYIHRIGRTGRAGETGTAITLVAPEDEEGVRKIERHLAARRQGKQPVKSESLQPRPRQTSGSSNGGRKPAHQNGHPRSREEQGQFSPRTDRGQHRPGGRPSGRPSDRGGRNETASRVRYSDRRPAPKSA